MVSCHGRDGQKVTCWEISVKSDLPSWMAKIKEKRTLSAGFLVRHLGNIYINKSKFFAKFPQKLIKDRARQSTASVTTLIPQKWASICTLREKRMLIFLSFTLSLICFYRSFYCCFFNFNIAKTIKNNKNQRFYPNAHLNGYVRVKTGDFGTLIRTK